MSNRNGKGKKAGAAGSNNNNSSSSSATDPEALRRKQEVTEHLISITQAIVDAINTRMFDFEGDNVWTRHFSPHFIGHAEPVPGETEAGLVGFEGHKRMFVHVTTLYPEYQVRIYDIKAEVDEVAGKATLFYGGETRGMGEGMVLPSVNTCDFERNADGVWQMVCSQGLRGMVDGTEVL
jgi:hypothetical protein